MKKYTWTDGDIVEVGRTGKRYMRGTREWVRSADWVVDRHLKDGTYKMVKNQVEDKKKASVFATYSWLDGDIIEAKDGNRYTRGKPGWSSYVDHTVNSEVKRGSYRVIKNQLAGIDIVNDNVKDKPLSEAEGAIGDVVYAFERLANAKTIGEAASKMDALHEAVSALKTWHSGYDYDKDTMPWDRADF